MAAQQALSNALPLLISSRRAVMSAADPRRVPRSHMLGMTWRPAARSDMSADGTPRGNVSSEVTAPCNRQTAAPSMRGEVRAAMARCDMSGPRPRGGRNGVELALRGGWIGIEIAPARLGRATEHRASLVAEIIRHRRRRAEVFRAVASFGERRFARKDNHDAQPNGNRPKGALNHPHDPAHQAL
ncbi:MAG TPA: hypothetical protein VLX67_07435 [Stellaceae bacterium]|nr:hypothetical protein [Stellaceae bacterium]